MIEPAFKQLDQVQILTTANVDWLSAPPGSPDSPHEVWTVVGVVGLKLLIQKNGTVIRIPHDDVRKVASYDSKSIVASIEAMFHHKLLDTIRPQTDVLNGQSEKSAEKPS